MIQKTMEHQTYPTWQPWVPAPVEATCPRQRKRIGLSLSGGGFRATVFHLGVLAWLAEQDRLEDVTFLSTVSGGSLCAGLLYALNDFRWPTSQEYRDDVLPRARDLLTGTDLQLAMMWRILRVPTRFFGTRADDLSALLQKHWGLTARLCDLPDRPRWLINTTCYETGQNFRIGPDCMGDPVLGYTYDTDLPLSEALAASAGFPGLIGALKLDTGDRSWFKMVYDGRSANPDHEGAGSPAPARPTKPTVPAYSRLHLWDGGVYDNLGLDALYDEQEGWRKDVDFLLASDACGRLQSEPYRVWKAPSRLVRGIMMDQVRSLRFRLLIERRLYHQEHGCYLQIGSTCADIMRAAGREEETGRLAPGYMDRETARRAAAMPTDIRKLSPENFELLFRHGFEVADYTLFGFYPEEFDYVGCPNGERKAEQLPSAPVGSRAESPERSQPLERMPHRVRWEHPAPALPM